MSIDELVIELREKAEEARALSVMRERSAISSASSSIISINEPIPEVEEPPPNQEMEQDKVEEFTESFVNEGLDSLKSKKKARMFSISRKMRRQSVELEIVEEAESEMLQSEASVGPGQKNNRKSIRKRRKTEPVNTNPKEPAKSTKEKAKESKPEGAIYAAIGAGESAAAKLIGEIATDESRQLFSRKGKVSAAAGLYEDDSLSTSDLASMTSGSKSDMLDSQSSFFRSSTNFASSFTLGSVDSMQSRATTASQDKRNALQDEGAPPGQTETIYMTETETPGILIPRTLMQALMASGFLKTGHPSVFDVVHDKNHRCKVYTDLEKFKYPTVNDPGIPHDLFTELPIEDPAALELELDISGEIERLNQQIKMSNVPNPSQLRRRGWLLCRTGKFEDGLHDLDKAIQFDPFSSDAHWTRHQIHLMANDVEIALKDLDTITDNNKAHIAAFWAKARIYQSLGILRPAIVNYSAVIRLKPECTDGYYNRACLFEKENEWVYANEDFKIVRQLDPTNEHAIFNLAMYSFQKQLWEDSIMAFSRLITLNAQNGQAYLYRGRANASLSKWDEALDVRIIF